MNKVKASNHVAKSWTRRLEGWGVDELCTSSTDLPFTNDNCRTSLLPDMASGNKSPNSTNSPRVIRSRSRGGMTGSPGEPAAQAKCIGEGCPSGRGADAGAGAGAAMGEVVGATTLDSKRSTRSRRGWITPVRSLRVRGAGCDGAGEVTWSALAEMCP